MEQELSTEIDLIIGILRSNPGQKFDYKTLHSLSGIPMHFLRNWISVLERQGHVKVSYNLTNIEFYWTGSDTASHDANRHSNSSHHLSGIVPSRIFHCSNDDISALLDKIKSKQEIIMKMKARQELLVKKKACDTATFSIMQIKLESKIKELSRLLKEAKKISSSAMPSKA